jgi:Holliday junction resolvasome RuvABC DNA-binding subunit
MYSHAEILNARVETLISVGYTREEAERLVAETNPAPQG